MTFKKDYIEICLTTEDGIQHLRCHGWLKRNQYLVKSEQVFRKGGEDFGMFIVVVPNKELVNIMEYEEGYLKIINALLEKYFGEAKAQIIMWWVFESINHEGEVSALVDENKKEHIINTPQELYKFLKRYDGK